MTSVSRPDYDRLLLGSPLRRKRVCIVICAALMAALSLATLIHLGLLASMRSDVASVFYRALALSSVLAAAPLTVLWVSRPARARGPMAVRCSVSMGRIYRHGACPAV